MRITLFGTRGSLPAPGPENARFGGNTSTVEVRGRDGTLLVLDAGTGIRRLGRRIPVGIGRIDLLLTHLHMDHIQGLGFFTPLYDPRIDVHIWGPGGSSLSLQARLSRYLSPPLFPVHLRDLPRVSCHEVPAGPFHLGGLEIRASYVCHPNPTLGYRIAEGAHALAYLPDHEPALVRPVDRWLESEWTSGFDLAADADLLIHDAQYTDAEYADCIGWGHSSYQHAFEFAARTGARTMVPFHHDPGHDDATLDRLLQDAVERFQPRFEAASGCEGASFEL
jgi:ribonuclease BN (tRNA processing enzyme)